MDCRLLNRSRSNGLDNAVAAALDALGYAIRLLLVFAVLSVAVSLVLGSRLLVGTKWGLFLTGWATFGYATLLLRSGSEGSDEVRSGTRLGRVIGKLPGLPASDSMNTESDPQDEGTRLPDGQKLFLASLVVLGCSFLLEWLFGVAG